MGHFEIGSGICLLHQANADLNASGNCGDTPLDIAKRHENNNAADRLRKLGALESTVWDRLKYWEGFQTP